jgi:hypothetical protein
LRLVTTPANHTYGQIAAGETGRMDKLNLTPAQKTKVEQQAHRKSHKHGGWHKNGINHFIISTID